MTLWDAMLLADLRRDWPILAYFAGVFAAMVAVAVLGNKDGD